MKSIKFLTALLLVLSFVKLSAQITFKVDNGKTLTVKDSSGKKPIQKFTLPDGKIITEEKVDSIGRAWGGFNMRRDLTKNPPEIFLEPRDPNFTSAQEKIEGEYRKKWLGALAPEFMLKDMNDNQVNLASLKGEVVVLNFWFTNCAPCIKEMPDLNKIVQKFDNSKVRFLAIGLDSKQEISNFLQKHMFNYQILYNAKKETKEFEIIAWPTHIVVDKSGKITFLKIGGDNIEGELSNAINDVL